MDVGVSVGLGAQGLGSVRACVRACVGRGRGEGWLVWCGVVWGGEGWGWSEVGRVGG